MKNIIGIDQADKNWLLGGEAPRMTRRISPKAVACNVIGLAALLSTIIILFAIAAMIG